MSILSPHDSAILASLFTAEPPAPVSSDPVLTPPLPPLPNFRSSLLTTIQTAEAHAIAPLNLPQPPESAILAAVSDLSDLISQHPTYPSAYNNRAQALRLLHGTDLTVCAVAESGMYDDLSTSIRLCLSDSPNGISEFQGGILAKAYTQRGYLLLRTATTLRKLKQEGSAGSTRLPRPIEERSADELEELARDDFREGKRWGSEVAGVMDVKMNPVRKLCGEIVREAMVRDMTESGVFPAQDALR